MVLTKAKEIELLQRQIDAAKDGDPDDFAEWRTTTETVSGKRRRWTMRAAA